MSTYNIHIEKAKSISYGFDTKKGYYFDIYDGDTLKQSESTNGTKMTLGRMLGLMELNNCPQNHKDAVSKNIMF